MKPFIVGLLIGVGALLLIATTSGCASVPKKVGCAPTMMPLLVVDPEGDTHVFQPDPGCRCVYDQDGHGTIDLSLQPDNQCQMPKEQKEEDNDSGKRNITYTNNL